jgi:SAM-dependent methyltransferase
MRELLLIHDRVFQRSHEEIARWLGVDRSCRVLDAGCGAGGMTAVLAALAGSVEALDLDAANVALTREQVAQSPGTTEVRVNTGDLTDLPYADETFDLVWCSRVIHHLKDMLAGVRELARITRRGGIVAIREGGFPFRVLPDDIGIGERWLEDRIGAAGAGHFGWPRVAEEGYLPYPFGWSQLLLDAGLVDVRARTFGFDALSPLSEDEQAWVQRQWRHWLSRDEWRALLDPADVSVLEQLLDPGSPHYVFARSDLHLRMGIAVYMGWKPLTPGRPQ